MKVIQRASQKYGTQAALADVIGVNIDTITDWKKGRREPRGSQLVALYRAAGMSMDEAFGLADAEDMRQARKPD